MNTTTIEAPGSINFALMSESIDDLKTSINILYLIISASLIFFMQAGFALVEAGNVTYDSATNILLKNFGDMSIISLLFWAFGFAAAFGDGNSFIGHSSYHFLNDYQHDLGLAFFLFQLSFCATAGTIVSGAVCERIRVHGYLLTSVLLGIIVYPVVARALWYSGGWLSAGNESAVAGGAIDFAGSGVVHLVGATCGLCGCIILGFRNQYSTDATQHPPRFYKDAAGKWYTSSLPPSSATNVALGVFILFLGWIFFNTGSIIYAIDNTSVLGRIAWNTILSACTSVFVCAFVGYCSRERDHGLLAERHIDISDVFNGVLAGLVCITAGCAVFDPWAAAVSGLLAGMVECYTDLLLLRLRIDDPVAVWPVHGASGALGLILVGFFARPEYVRELYSASADVGIVYGGTGRLLGAQLLEILFILCWTGAFSCPLFFLFNYIDSNRMYPMFTYRGDMIERTTFGEGEDAGSGASDAIVLKNFAFDGLGGNVVFRKQRDDEILPDDTEVEFLGLNSSTSSSDSNSSSNDAKGSTKQLVHQRNNYFNKYNKVDSNVGDDDDDDNDDDDYDNVDQDDDGDRTAAAVVAAAAAAAAKTSGSAAKASSPLKKSHMSTSGGSMTDDNDDDVKLDNFLQTSKQQRSAPLIRQPDFFKDDDDDDAFNSADFASDNINTTTAAAVAHDEDDDYDEAEAEEDEEATKQVAKSNKKVAGKKRSKKKVSINNNK